MTNKLVTTLLLLLLLSIQFSFGQKIKWAKYDILPFKEDTSDGFLTKSHNYPNYLIPAHDITQSRAILEIRVIPYAYIHETLPISVFEFYKDSTILNEYYRVPSPEIEAISKKYRDSSSEALTAVMTPLLKKKPGGFDWKIVKKRISEKEAKKMLDELIKRNLFTIDGDEEIAVEENRIKANRDYFKITQSDTLKRSSIDLFRAAIIEVNYKNRIRTFRTGGVAFFYWDKNQKKQIINNFLVGADLIYYLIPTYKPKNYSTPSSKPKK